MVWTLLGLIEVLLGFTFTNKNRRHIVWMNSANVYCMSSTKSIIWLMTCGLDKRPREYDPNAQDQHRQAIIGLGSQDYGDSFAFWGRSISHFVRLAILYLEMTENFALNAHISFDFGLKGKSLLFRERRSLLFSAWLELSCRPNEIIRTGKLAKIYNRIHKCLCEVF